MKAIIISDSDARALLDRKRSTRRIAPSTTSSPNGYKRWARTFDDDTPCSAPGGFMDEVTRQRLKRDWATLLGRIRAGLRDDMFGQQAREALQILGDEVWKEVFEPKALGATWDLSRSHKANEGPK
jgi:hypothetical protein